MSEAKAAQFPRMRTQHILIAVLAVSLAGSLAVHFLPSRETVGQRLRRECESIVFESHADDNGAGNVTGALTLAIYDDKVRECVHARGRIVP